MILLNNKRLCKKILLIQPADPDYALPVLVCRVWRFETLLKAKVFAQSEGVLIPDHNLVVRFVGSTGPDLVGSINIVDQIDAFMDAAAAWLAEHGSQIHYNS